MPQKRQTKARGAKQGKKEEETKEETKTEMKKERKEPVPNKQGWMLVNTSQGGAYDVPPETWIDEEMLNFGVVVPNTRRLPLSTLKGPLHPLFDRARFPTLSDARYAALTPSLHLATNMLSACLLYIAHFLPEPNFHNKEYTILRPAEEEGDDDDEGAEVCDITRNGDGIGKKPPPTIRIATWASEEQLRAADAMLRNTIVPRMTWQEDDELYSKHNMLGYTYSAWPAPPHLTDEDANLIRESDDLIRRDDQVKKEENEENDEGTEEKTGHACRRNTIFFMADYINTLVSTPPTSVAHQTAAFHCAHTLVHEVGHMIYWYSTAHWNPSWIEPRVNDDVSMELGDAMIGWLFAGWIPIPIISDEEKKSKTFSFQHGTEWKKCVRLPVKTTGPGKGKNQLEGRMERPVWEMRYGMPFAHIQRLFNQETWNHVRMPADSSLPTPAKCHQITSEVLRPPLKFRRGKHVRRAICHKRRDRETWEWLWKHAQESRIWYYRHRDDPLYDEKGNLVDRGEHGTDEVKTVVKKEEDVEFAGNWEDYEEPTPEDEEKDLNAPYGRFRPGHKLEGDRSIFFKPAMQNSGGDDGDTDIVRDSDPFGNNIHVHFNAGRRRTEKEGEDDDESEADDEYEEERARRAKQAKEDQEQDDRFREERLREIFLGIGEARNREIERTEREELIVETPFEDDEQNGVNGVDHEHPHLPFFDPDWFGGPIDNGVDEDDWQNRYEATLNGRGHYRNDRDNDKWIPGKEAVHIMTEFRGDFTLADIIEYDVPPEFQTGASSMSNPPRLPWTANTPGIENHTADQLRGELLARGDRFDGDRQALYERLQQHMMGVETFKAQKRLRRDLWHARWTYERKWKTITTLVENPNFFEYPSDRTMDFDVFPEQHVVGIKQKWEEELEVPQNDFIIHVNPPDGRIFLTQEKDGWTYGDLARALRHDAQEEQRRRDVPPLNPLEPWPAFVPDETIPATMEDKEYLDYMTIGLYRYRREGAPAMQWVCARLPDPQDVRFHESDDQMKVYPLGQPYNRANLQDMPPPFPPPPPGPVPASNTKTSTTKTSTTKTSTTKASTQAGKSARTVIAIPDDDDDDDDEDDDDDQDGPPTPPMPPLPRGELRRRGVRKGWSARELYGHTLRGDDRVEFLNQDLSGDEEDDSPKKRKRGGDGDGKDGEDDDDDDDDGDGKGNGTQKKKKKKTETEEDPTYKQKKNDDKGDDDEEEEVEEEEGDDADNKKKTAKDTKKTAAAKKAPAKKKAAPKKKAAAGTRKSTRAKK